MNTLIKNAYILTMDDKDTVYENGAVAVEGEKISYVGRVEGLPVDFHPTRTIDACGSVVMPGFVNAHTHLAMTLLRGYGSDMNLQDWLENKMWPAEDKLIDGYCYWGSMLGIAEMIRTGTTAFLDMYFFMEETARAVEETGIRAVLSRGITGRTPGYKKALGEAEALHRGYNNTADGRLTVMLGPHAEYTCDEQSIRQVVELGHRLGCGMHVHIQETVPETKGCFERYGMSPVAWFDSMGLFSCHTVAAHCVTASDEDIALLAERRVHVAHNPGSNMKLASGIAPVDRMLKTGINVALGTDGPSSNNNLDMLEETRLAALCAKVRENNPTVIDAKTALAMATANGARALGIDTKCGSIETGKNADIIMFEASSPAMHPRIDMLSNIVYSAGSSDIAMTMVNGKILMEKGIINGIDLERVYYETDKIAAAICG